MCAFQMLEKHVDNVEECTMKESCTVASAVKSAWCSVLQLTEADGMPAWCFSDNEPTAVKVGRDLHMGSQRCEPHIFGIMVKRIFFHLTDDDQAAGGRTRARKVPRHPAIFHRWEKMRDIGLYYHIRRHRHNHWKRYRNSLEGLASQKGLGRECQRISLWSYVAPAAPSLGKLQSAVPAWRHGLISPDSSAPPFLRCATRSAGRGRPQAGQRLQVVLIFSDGAS